MGLVEIICDFAGFLRVEEEDESGVVPASLSPFHDACLRVDRGEILARFAGNKHDGWFYCLACV